MSIFDFEHRYALRRNAQLSRHRRVLCSRIAHRFRVLRILLCFTVLKRAVYVKRAKYIGAVRLRARVQKKLLHNTLSKWFSFTASCIYRKLQYRRAHQLYIQTTGTKLFQAWRQATIVSRGKRVQRLLAKQWYEQRLLFNVMWHWSKTARHQTTLRHKLEALRNPTVQLNREIEVNIKDDIHVDVGNVGFSDVNDVDVNDVDVSDVDVNDVDVNDVDAGETIPNHSSVANSKTNVNATTKKNANVSISSISSDDAVAHQKQTSILIKNQRGTATTAAISTVISTAISAAISTAIPTTAVSSASTVSLPTTATKPNLPTLVSASHRLPPRPPPSTLSGNLQSHMSRLKNRLQTMARGQRAFITSSKEYTAKTKRLEELARVKDLARQKEEERKNKNKEKEDDDENDKDEDNTVPNQNETETTVSTHSSIPLVRRISLSNTAKQLARTSFRPHEERTNRTHITNGTNRTNRTNTDTSTQNQIVFTTTPSKFKSESQSVTPTSTTTSSTIATNNTVYLSPSRNLKNELASVFSNRLLIKHIFHSFRTKVTQIKFERLEQEAQALASLQTCFTLGFLGLVKRSRKIETIATTLGVRHFLRRMLRNWMIASHFQKEKFIQYRFFR